MVFSESLVLYKNFFYEASCIVEHMANTKTYFHHPDSGICSTAQFSAGCRRAVADPFQRCSYRTPSLVERVLL